MKLPEKIKKRFTARSLAVAASGIVAAARGTPTTPVANAANAPVVSGDRSMVLVTNRIEGGGGDVVYDDNDDEDIINKIFRDT